jgi:hypothetical protein
MICDEKIWDETLMEVVQRSQIVRSKEIRFVEQVLYLQKVMKYPLVAMCLFR